LPSDVVLETSRIYVVNYNDRYLRYSNIAAKTLRSVLVPELRATAMKREEIALKKALWKDGKMGESVFKINVESTSINRYFITWTDVLIHDFYLLLYNDFFQ
jgi:hypothetical protein